MKFGKEFGIHLEETLPEWRDKYLCYKPLKKLLKNLPPTPPPAADDPSHPPPPPPPPAPPAVAGDPPPPPPPLADLQDWFIRILSEELEKFNDFYVDKEEEFVIRFQELKQRIEQVKEKSFKDGVFPYESEFSDEMMDIRKDFVTIHGEMVLLKNYSSLNFAGIIKILKKYDKRTGGLLSLQFTQLALRQPFFTTEYLTRLVHECEENLELLFPLEAEVVESTRTPQDQMDPAPTNMANSSSEPSSSSPPQLGDEASDVYRMTLAAMKTIKGLKKASSTYNPLSFASIFGGQGSDSAGAVTAENSGSDSPTSQNEEQSNEDGALPGK